MSIRSTLQDELHVPVRWVSPLLKLELPFSRGRLPLLLRHACVVSDILPEADGEAG